MQTMRIIFVASAVPANLCAGARSGCTSLVHVFGGLVLLGLAT